MFALDLLNQFQSYNGTLLAAGKIYVYHLGRTHLAPVYGDHNGATVLPNPVILDDQGMAEIYLNDAFNYTVVVCDAYGAEQFSRDVYPKGMGNGESIGTQLYEGIDPIVVNNDVYAISANTSRLGVVTPLYFVKDDEEETIIGFSGEAIIPSGTMNESAIGYEDGKITSYNGSAFSAGLNYSAGDNIVINGAIIALDSAINLLDAQGAKAVSIDATEQQFTNLTSNNGSILDASGLYVSDLNMENAANLSKDGLYVTGTGSRISMSNDMSDIYGDNHFEIYGYQESGDGISAMHLGGNDLIVEHGENRTITASYSLTGACSSAQSALNIINSSDLTEYSAGANIDITDHVVSGKDWTNEINDASANAYSQSTAWTDSQGYLTGVDLSEYAKTDFVVSSIDAATSGKYDTSSFSAISGSFLTAHQSLPQSADWNGATTVVNNNSAIWNNTTNVVSSNSASWGATNPQIPVTGINGIKISESGDKVVFEVSGDYATHDDLTSKQDSLTYGYRDTAISSIDSSALYDNSAHARINTLAGRISDLSSNKLDESAFSDVSGSFLTAHQDLSDYQLTADMTAYQPVGDYQTAGDYYSASNPSGFITGVDLEPYQLKADMTAYQSAGNYLVPDNITGKLDTTAFSDVSGSFLTAHQSLEGYATEDWVTAQGYLTAETDWTDTITAASANAYEQATAAIPAPFDPTYISGQIDNKLDSAIYAADSGNFLTSLPSDLVYTADIQDMATTAQVSEKLDTTAFSTVSGNFLTSVDLTPYQTTAGMTAYQPAGDYYSASNPSGFITGVDLTPYQTTAEMTAYQPVGDYYSASNPSGFITGVDLAPYQLTADMTAYQPAGDYLTTADSAQFYTTDNPSGFITGVDLSNYATTADVAEKLDSTAFSDVSGNFLTAHQSLDGLMSADLLEFSGSVITAYSGCKFAGEISGDAGDAEVNALVHSNSGTWESVTGKLDTTAFSTVSGDFYTTANESGFITGVPAGTMNESNFGYDASDNITGYNGSAFKAGDEFPQSATEAIEVVTANSADWNGTTETVSSNSASWGGEPLPLSSRDGIDLEIDNNVLWIGASALSSIYQPITGMTAYQTVLTLETGSI